MFLVCSSQIQLSSALTLPSSPHSRYHSGSNALCCDSQTGFVVLHGFAILSEWHGVWAMYRWREAQRLPKQCNAAFIVQYAAKWYRMQKICSGEYSNHPTGYLCVWLHIHFKSVVDIIEGTEWAFTIQELDNLFHQQTCTSNLPKFRFQDLWWRYEHTPHYCDGLYRLIRIFTRWKLVRMFSIPQECVKICILKLPGTNSILKELMGNI